MPAAFKDYYATLGISKEASAEEIKKAFRKMARKFHPDVAGEKDKAGAEEKFKEINEAYEVLSDPDKRAKYDQLGSNWNSYDDGSQAPQSGGFANAGDPNVHFGGTGFSDFFEQYFSGGTRYGFPSGEAAGFGSGQARAYRGSDVEGDILVTLEEALKGTQRPISMQMVNRETGQAQTHTFEVRIPPGATDGRRIRVPGQGEPGHGGGPAGDLFLRVRHAAHPDFSARETDLYHELDIAAWEGVLGAEVVVPTLDGSIKLRIPAGAENGQKLRVRSRGLPKGKTGERGDFYVVLNVVLPSSINDAERVAWEKVRETSAGHPRAAH